MKTVLSLALAALLAACGTAPTMTSSFNGMHYRSGPTDKDDPRLARPQFYRDEGDDAWWAHAGNPGVR
jgi:hypothetical protein